MKKTNRTKIKQKIKYSNQINLSKPSIKVYKSNLYTYALVLNYNKVVLKSFDSRKIKGKKVDSAFEVGKLAGDFLLKSNLDQAYFDRNGYQYHGRVKAVADGAREAGVKF